MTHTHEYLVLKIVSGQLHWILDPNATYYVPVVAGSYVFGNFLVLGKIFEVLLSLSGHGTLLGGVSQMSLNK